MIRMFAINKYSFRGISNFSFKLVGLIFLNIYNMNSMEPINSKSGEKFWAINYGFEDVFYTDNECFHKIMNIFKEEEELGN